VFVHASALRRAGLTDLAEGQTAAIQITQGAKGPEATFIRPTKPWDEPGQPADAPETPQKPR